MVGEPCQSDDQTPSHQGGPPPRISWLASQGMFVKPVFVAITLLALVQSAPAQSPAAVTALTSGYTLDTPLETIAADPAGSAILNKYIPGLLTDPSYEIIKSMTLKTIARLSGGELTDQMLAHTEADLKALSAQKKPNQN
jgi:hypothetical protein